MASKQPTNYESLKAGDTAQPLVKDMLRMPGWEPTYVEIPIHWYHNNQWHNANYVAVTGHIVRKNTQGETWERPITVFVDSMIYNPRYAYLETSPNLYKSSESIKVKSTNNVAGSEYLEFIDLHFRSYDIQYAKVPIDTSAGKNSYFLVIQPLLRVINAERFMPMNSPLLKSVVEGMVNKVTMGNASKLMELWSLAGKPLQHFT